MLWTQRLRQGPVAAVMLTALVAAALAVPAAAAAAQRWIVPANGVLPSGATVVATFPFADAIVIRSTSAPAQGVPFDAPLELRSLTGAPGTDGLHVDTGVASTGAPAAWELGEFGDQAVVAVVDTGVAPVEALEGAVAGEINFTSSPRGGDGYGHGTFIASLIAGRGPLAPGVAPEAGILSLKVADAKGAATLGSVMSALQWLHGTGSRAGIRVATLALGVDPGDEAADLLEAATNAVADAGVLVVTASGNEGADNLSSPATATGTYSVGALDDNATADRSDDVVADYSGTGPDRAGAAQPDAVASGTNVIGSMPLDSVISRQNPSGRIAGADSELFRGTGTSMSTALVAGVAALASSARPDLRGEALAAALGSGQVDAVTAVSAALAQPAGTPVDTPPWGDPGENPGNGNAYGHSKGGKNQATPNGLRWTGLRWTGLRWTGLRWTGLRWTGLRWTGLRWTGEGWGDTDWVFGTWAGLRWTGKSWAGAMTEPTFEGLRWTGLRWSGLRWSGLRWSGLRWSGLRWSMLEAPPA